MSIPKISVIMSVYKEPLDWVQQSIDSILQQTFSSFEFIIINDNPDRKDLHDFLENKRTIDSRIVIVHNEENIGLTKSLNKALKIVQGEYVARMDADDISYPERFERQLEYMEIHKNVGVCGSYIDFFGDKKGQGKYPIVHENIFLFVENCFAHPTVFIRARLLKQYKYDESYKVSQDLALWIKLYAEGVEFGNLPIALLKYRFSKSQITSLYNQKQVELSKKLRREAFNIFSLKNGYCVRMEEETFSYNFIGEVCSIVKLPKGIMGKFVYYLLLSVNGFNFSILRKHCMKYLSIVQILKLLTHKLLRHNIRYY